MDVPNRLAAQRLQQPGWKEASASDKKAQEKLNEGEFPNGDNGMPGTAADAQDRVAVVHNEENTEDEDLLKLSRAELNNLASDLGVDHPSALANKDEVVEAINQKRGSGPAEDESEDENQE